MSLRRVHLALTAVSALSLVAGCSREEAYAPDMAAEAPIDSIFWLITKSP